MAAERFHSAAVLKFGDDSTLFIGDSKGSALLAARISPQRGRVDRFFNVYDVDRKMAALLGCELDEVLINDLAVHPVTGRAYLAVEHGKTGTPAILHLGPDEDIELLDLGSLQFSRVTLADPLPRRPGIPVGSVAPLDLTITDIACYGNIVLVAGLTNNAFRSTLRLVRYPFEEQPQQSFIEMYHTVHDRLETRAPINKLTVVELDGIPTVIAAYTCTPVVAIRLADLAVNQKVSAKTIAEIGYSSIPTSMFAFKEPLPDGGSRSVLLITDKQRSAALFSMDDFAAAVRGPGMTTPAMFDPAGVPYRPLPLAGVMRAADQADDKILTLRRNMDTGRYDLISWPKGLYVRASDFVNGIGLEHYTGDDPLQKQLEQNVQRMARNEGLPLSARE
jgi:hypothetical protein